VTPALTAFNTAAEAQLRARLHSCCEAELWVQRVLAARPYASESELLATSDDATGTLDDAGLGQALAGHPRIGDRAATHTGEGRSGAWSRQEQAAVADAEAELLAEIAAANVEYERRFGHVYLVCATGRGAAELLDVCRARLDNDHETEHGLVLEELAKINRLRLIKLLSEEAQS
jgi:2-oxo-4-hydroxy-4-carboxy-5-ureidoimidazoline decarboxylase